MRDLAAQVGMSDVGLKKVLRAHGVTTPPQGHWNKVHAGRPVPERPKAPDRRPGERGRIRLDEKFSKVLSAAPAIPVEGPFASKFVPEDLEELRAMELKALGKVAVPPNLLSAHPGLVALMKKEERQREKYSVSRYSWDEPKFDNPFDQRRLRFANGLFRALAKRGHSGNAHEQGDELHFGAVIGDTFIAIQIDAAGNQRKATRRGYASSKRDIPASTPMLLKFGSMHRNEPGETWQDDKSGKIESRLAEIAAGVIVAGEAAFRRGLRAEQERLEEARRYEEARRQEKLAALEKERLGQLRRSGELLREAEDIRRLVEGVKAAVLLGEQPVSGQDLENWEKWAVGYADRIDPIKSGQFLTHVQAPKLPGD